MERGHGGMDRTTRDPPGSPTPRPLVGRPGCACRPRSDLANPATEQMAQRRGDRVGDVRSLDGALGRHEALHHCLDLVLFSAARTRDALLDRRGRVFVDGNRRAADQSEDDASRMSKLECGARAGAMEWGFHGGCRRPVGLEDGRHLVLQPREPPLKGQSLGKDDGAACEEHGTVGSSAENGPACAARARIDSEDSRAGSQDASSAIAESS